MRRSMRRRQFVQAVPEGDANGGSATNTPIIHMTAQREKLHTLRAFERGVDDVVVKPLSYPELVARVRAVLRRADPRASHEQLVIGPLSIDRARRMVILRGESVAMSQKEFKLLWRMASDPTKVFTKEQLMRELWGSENGSSRTLDSHACRVRNKLRVQGDPFVSNVWGVGYRLLDGPARDTFAS